MNAKTLSDYILTIFVIWMLQIFVILPILDPYIQLGLQTKSVVTFTLSVFLGPPVVLAFRRYTDRWEHREAVE